MIFGCFWDQNARSKLITIDQNRILVFFSIFFLFRNFQKSTFDDFNYIFRLFWNGGHTKNKKLHPLKCLATDLDGALQTDKYFIKIEYATRAKKNRKEF